jgi:urea transport system permease protein
MLRGDYGGQILIAILIMACVVVPYLNLYVPPESPLHLSTFTVTLLGKYLTYALLALSVDLVWGYLAS